MGYTQAITKAFRLDGQRELKDLEKMRIERIKLKAAELATEFSPTDSREKQLAMTKLEECVMWATKGITE
jgi:hypothetical protein